MANKSSAPTADTAPVAHASSQPRKLKKPEYTSFKLQKRIRAATPPILGGYTLMREATGLLVRNWRLFGGMILIYGCLQLLLVQGFSNVTDISAIKDSVEALAAGNTGRITASLTSFGYLLGTAGAGGAYQAFVVLITSLALIWTIRQVHADERPHIKDGFYQGMFPLVPFVIVLFVVLLQTLPAVMAITLFSFASANGIILQGIEYLLWIALISVSVLASLYMMCSSLFALYIVTLPGMTPLRALRSARELVRFRRWKVMRRIIFLPIALTILAGIVMVPLIILATAASGYIFVLLSLLGIAIIHSYMYRLYKELLA